VRTFQELVAEADSVDVSGWGFEWLRGRATEERPPWGYARLLAQRLPEVASALDIDTGGGEVLAELPVLPNRMCATESWPPNLARATDLLGQGRVEVVQTRAGQPLPFPDASFELITSRHPIRPDWPCRALPGHAAPARRADQIRRRVRRALDPAPHRGPQRPAVRRRR
jgi:hypothetical protein